MFTVPPRNNNESENNTKYDNVLLTKNTLSPDLRSLIKERFSFVNDHVLVEKKKAIVDDMTKTYNDPKDWIPVLQ
jgi:hypothetical protein